MNDKKTKFKPLLDNDACNKGFITGLPWNDERAIGALNARNFYEAARTNGLMEFGYVRPTLTSSCPQCGSDSYRLSTDPMDQGETMCNVCQYPCDTDSRTGLPSMFRQFRER